MPNLENLEKKPFLKNHHQNLLNVRHEDIFYRKDLRDGFGYAVVHGLCGYEFSYP